MNKYTITSTKFSGQAIVGYKDDYLVLFDFSNAELSPTQNRWFVEQLPVHEGDLPQFIEQYKTLSHSLIPEDLSFERFWNEYKYKVGNMKRAKALWLALSEAEKIKVFQAIPRYNNWLKLHPNVERLYPETFLFQRRFENQF